MNDEFIRRFFGGSGGFGASSHHSNDPFMNMHSEFQRMFEEMDQMMSRFHYGNFNMIDQPNESIDLPNEENSINKNESLRDKFLKSSSNKKTNEIVPSYRQPSFFESFFDYPAINKQNVNETDDFEEDLDKKIAREGFDRVFREDILKNKNSNSIQQHQQQKPFNYFQSFGQSSSVRRIQRPDGTIEEVKTVRDSDGKEVKTVTRIIGDKMHSLVEKRNKNGVEETEEYFQNFDHDKIDEFNKEWNGSTRLPSNYNDYSLPSKNELKSEIQSGETANNSNKNSWLSKLFSKLF